MTRMGIKALLFDLGGVLIQLGGITEVMGWTGWEYDEFWRHWLASPSVRDFEAGKLSAGAFGAALVNEFSLPVTAGEFLDQFATWPQGVYPGAEELLQEAGGTYRLGCLSNTNSLHWAHFTQDSNLMDYFDCLLPSHHTGFLKPDHIAFTHAAEEMGCLPEQILFLDDNQINIEGAMAAGLESRLVHGAGEARSILQDLGLIIDPGPQSLD